MKPLTLKTLLAGVLIFAGLHVKAQTEQSAIYDAIALLNAKHNISVLQLPGIGGYKVVNPVTGATVRDGQSGPLLDSELDPANAQKVIQAILSRDAGFKNVVSIDSLKNIIYKDNSFLIDLLTPTADTSKLAQKLLTTVGALNISSASGSPGTNLATNLANGVADFLIKRANEELTVSIIAKLQDFLARYPEFKTLFPQTVALIAPIQPYDYAKTLNALKTALKADLDQLPGRLQLLYYIPRYQVINTKVPVLTLGFASVTLANDINGKFGLSKSLHDLDTSKFLTAKNNYASAINVLCLLSNGLQDKLMSQDDSQEYPYLDSGVIKAVTAGNTGNMVYLAQYFTGIIAQKSSTISFYNGSSPLVTTMDILKAWKGPDIATFFNQLQSNCAQLTTLQAQLLKIKSDDLQNTNTYGKSFFSSDRPAIYSQLLSTSMTMAIAFLQSPDQKGLKDQLTLINNSWPSFSSNTVNMIQAFSQKDYSAGTQDLGEVLKSVTDYLENAGGDVTTDGSNTLKTQSAATIATINSQIAAINTEIKSLPPTANLSTENAAVINDQLRGYQAQLSDLNLKLYAANYQSKNAKTELLIIGKIIEYTQLFAALSQVDNSSDVESLLETYALPAGSSRVKKETDFNIALNAYVGGFFGRSGSSGTGFTNTYGLTAPIGFTVSHGFNECGSVSVFAGLLDVGSIIRYKLDNNGAYEQNINFAGLVSPSVQLIYGLPWYIPLSIGAGCQWTTPTTSSSNQIHLMPHFNAFIAVDIPLFNLTAVRKQP